ncbi:Cytochrome c-552/4 domain-containing protein [Vibrio crassostreae]|uniref:tetratricopeptide repeat protein n=1 Tax=Vibrio crassostreae TaxID=246167 RepID=UPI0005E442D9|nr:tetratricopeptide repeat protein [Vibrio crassostreae]TCT64831.1 putative CXXCH cytochrome family protein [Vibrio crassostreae]TCT74015.1 putative CXXCH cytochrome family protein [Vibrio crassostreae]TCT85049.1 putative CXXCH cytochrome family protein [Vibrio crassostreae]TCU05077.1 putative CXXCH cytochrome family protein [Vibrio crassostreae]TDW09013.1 putative CXXCH cytochrome family protein [Vibrio crassostreae]
MSAWLCLLVNGLKHQRVAVLSAMLSLPMLSLLSVNTHANEQALSVGSEASHANSQATYVGSEACIDCHSAEVEAWQGSHHDMAMKHADDESVLGNFDDQIVTHKGKPNRFFRKGDEFWVNIEGPDDQFKDYKISYTFAFEPLQQYMVEFEDGRVQLIPFAWDSRTEDEGGQRWFHLYPDTTNTDEFYWTNSGQNWNFMCADCHSTNLEKNYDSASNTYNTTWSEINVGCEACHGPASAHVEQAKLARANGGKEDSVSAHYGFDRDLSKSVKEWIYQEGNSTLQPKDIIHTNQVQTCAQCHSRRTQLNETGDHVNGSFFDKYRLSLITPELYHNDGQIYDEDYVYGSFLQSVMAEKGVTCTNCHDPHTAELKIAEEAVCSQCHIASEYTPEKHTFHEANTEASQCTTCHMPETTYMEVDPRRDHSWHIPRPDISQHIKTPNVCTSCHEDQTDQWADQQIGKWFPDSKYRNQQHFAVAFYADSIGHRGAEDALAYSAQDSSLSNIIRASSLERLGGNTGKNTLISLARAVKHDDEMIRLGVVQGSSGFPFTDRWQILEPLLKDPVLSIRSETASALVRYWGEMNPLQKDQIKPALEEYIEIQQFNADRGFGRTNLGNVYRDLGQHDKAIEFYQGAIEIEPYFENSYANLADLYRALGDEPKALSTLKQGIQAQPKSSVLPYSAGLSMLRVKDYKQATNYLKQAAETAQTDPQYWYVYGLALEKSDVLAASKSLNKAYQFSRNPQHLYAQCEILARNYQQPGVPKAFEQCVASLSKVAPPEAIAQLKASIN